MSTVDEFGRRIEAELLRAKPTMPVAAAKEFMAQFEERFGRFERQAQHLVDVVIRPRVEKLTTFYPNGSPGRHKESRSCGLWLGYMENFPANAHFEFSILHDEDVTSLVVSFQSHIVPSFIKYDRFDRLAVPLDSAADDQVAAWVEDCLLRFIRACVAVSQGGAKDENIQVADPVCGMQVAQSTSTAHTEYLGHSYYFCGARCRDKFAAEPLRYVAVTTDY